MSELTGTPNHSVPTDADPAPFSRSEDRDRLTPVTLKAFRTLAEHWKLSNPEAATLLGVSESTWDRIKRGTWDQALSQDQLMRASVVIGTYKALHLLFADGMADRWPKLPNKGLVFQRRTPVEAMAEGGIPTMIEVRQHVDALEQQLTVCSGSQIA